MSTLLAVVPRVFAGLPLISEQSPGDGVKPHIGRRAPNLASADRVRQGRRSIECVTGLHRNAAISRPLPLSGVLIAHHVK